MLYERNKRFARGSFAPILRHVDKFLKLKLSKGLPEREERAELVHAADEALGTVVPVVKANYDGRGADRP